ncbi:MAG: glycoside hydrolase family 2 protein [Planctomycetes bacterium]|nr:glycoside hydrolase family 2 protein [Planctomycetota bacterium]
MTLKTLPPACPSILCLDGAWTLRQAAEKESIPAQVPGCVHQDLLSAGCIPDPQVRDNEKGIQWIGESDWVYERAFRVDPSLLGHELIELVCEGLDTLAEISINGQKVAGTDNMHRCYRFDIGRFLCSGENELVVRFSSPLRYMRERQSERAMPHWPSDHTPPGISWLRKAHHNFGWDFAQKLATCGIWRSIRIEGRSHTRMGDIRVLQKHREDGVDLTVIPEWIHVGRPCCRWRAVLRLRGKTVCQSVCNEDESKSLEIADPELWWPAGMGGQPLYELFVELAGPDDSVVEQKRIRVGLRTLRLKRVADAWGESFQFEANGRPFFAKGSSWIPTDSYASCRRAEFYRDLLKSAADAHMNMIRVWGGGIFEEEYFYEICDELGLCVWQDFLFACNAYPLDEPAFRENVEIESAENVKRLQHHACIALWCGNNELELGWKKGWGLIGEDWQYGAFGHMPCSLHSDFFDRALNEIVVTHDGTRDYWPGSPHSPQGDRKDSNNPDCGDAHLWDVNMGNAPFAFYQGCFHRFISEFGFQSLPGPRLLEKVTAEEDRNFTSRIMDYHQRMPAGNPTILHQLARHLPLPSSFALSLWATQILHAILLETAIGHWRRNTPRTMGVLNWVLNDQWPAMTNATLDAEGNWKASHYALKRLYSPVLVSAVVLKDPRRVEIHVSSDRQRECAVELEWTVLRTDGCELERGVVSTTLPGLADRSVHVLQLEDLCSRESEENLLIWLNLKEEGELISTTVEMLVPPKHLHLYDPKLSVVPSLTEKGSTLFTLSAERPALWVWADPPGLRRLSDNFFHLKPGESKEVLVEGDVRGEGFFSLADFTPCT